MAILALITKPEEIPLVVPWASEFAKARKSSLTVMCWTYSPLPLNEKASTDGDDLIAEVRRFIDESKETGSLFQLAELEAIKICGSLHPEASTAALNMARSGEFELIVAAAEDQTGETGATYATNSLLRHSPCNTIILFGGPERSCKADRVFVGVMDSPHDAAALFLASRMVEAFNSKLTLARREKEFEQAAFEVGRRELQELIRDAGVEHEHRIECRVFSSGNMAEIAAFMDEQDLLVVGANNPNVRAMLELTTNPTVAVIKRAPPLRRWLKRKSGANWNPRLSTADYADLIQGLRLGSRLSADFLVMLSLSAVVASMGLLQDSPAVVIGSMLLAPLMTPMLGCGLALAQANPKLGNRALVSVGVGLLCSLAISTILGVLTPGVELTPQVLARGDPTVLDLVVAVASAAAGAYALARPNLLGSIAGVAIATALVPPLCSVGLSLAYLNLANAQGAALLFGTNFVAIVLAGAVTFRIMGVRATRAGSRQRIWVFRTVAVLGVAALLFCVPLQIALMRSLLAAKPQPTTYPLARKVIEALEDHIEDEPDIELIAAGRPSSLHVESDVVLWLGAPRDLDREYSKELIEIVRREMKDNTLVVEVHCIRELWQEKAN